MFVFFLESKFGLKIHIKYPFSAPLSFREGLGVRTKRLHN